MDFLADTDFLVALWREQRSPGPATRFARAHTDETMGLCWVVAAEFLSGAAVASQDVTAAWNFLAPYPLVQSAPAIISRYAELFALLKKANNLIGPNDLWIAACGLVEDRPLITRNIREFHRVPDLRLIDYTNSPAK